MINKYESVNALDYYFMKICVPGIILPLITFLINTFFEIIIFSRNENYNCAPIICISLFFLAIWITGEDCFLDMRFLRRSYIYKKEVSKYHSEKSNPNTRTIHTFISISLFILLTNLLIIFR